MGFGFGIMSSIPADIGTICFIGVVSFLILFEYITSYIDYMQEYYQASYEMIKKVYKELMILGVISFTVTLYVSTQAAHSHDDWIIATGKHIFSSCCCLRLFLFFIFRFLPCTSFLYCYLHSSTCYIPHNIV